MKLNDEIILNIEKLVYGSDGLSRYNDDDKKNFVVFIGGVLPDEKIKAKIVSINKSYARAELVEILEPSIHRLKPLCPLYNACGSCDFQIADYDYTLKIKNQIIKDIFCDCIEEDKIFNIIKSPKILNYRCKIQFPTRQTKNSKRMLMGYFKPKTHELTNVKFCPMQPEIINEIAQFIREFFPRDCYCEKNRIGFLKNVVFRITSDEKSVLINFVINANEDEFEKINPKLFKFSKKLAEKFEVIKSIFVNLNPEAQNKILSDKEFKLFGTDEIIETLGDKKFYIGSSSFFQVNPCAALKLFDIVKDCIKENSTVLDAYGGVGAIGIYVEDKAKKITLVEENKNAIKTAKKNFLLNKIENFEIQEGDASQYFKNLGAQNKIFDYVILDPPRKGCDKQGLETISKMTKNIIYVSCNPQTLKRDMKTLFDCGFCAKFIKSVDMFPFTHHIETVVKFEKM